MKRSNKPQKKFVYKKKRGKYFFISFLAIIILGLIVGGIYFYNKTNFLSEINIEIGTESLALKDFFKRDVPKKASFVSDVKHLDLNVLTDYKVKIKIGKKVHSALVHMVDTTKPEVVFQDVSAYIDYELKLEDFIVSCYDLTPTTIEIEGLPEARELGIYDVVIKVKDSSGNVSSSNQKFIIGAVKPTFNLELGDKLTAKDLVYDKEDASEIDEEEIKRINASPVGEYVIKSIVKDREYETKITIADTKAPSLILKSLTVYDDETSLEAKDFVKKVTDASTVTLNLKTEISYGKIGKYTITIEAVDSYQNKVEKTTKLTIKKDTDAPVISGLTTLKINKGQTPNYLSGVKANDKKDGQVDVSITNNPVNNQVAGTYYVSYQAKDKAGNKATKKREVIVKHDAQDLKNKINEVASKIGNSPEAIVNYVNSHMHNANTWGDGDATWYGLINWRGNCYVHASVVKALMEAKGYQAQLTNAVGNGHYWVLAYVNGSWLHYDSVSAYKLIGGSEEERIATLKGKFTWDKPSWLEAV